MLVCQREKCPETQYIKIEIGVTVVLIAKRLNVGYGIRQRSCLHQL